MTRTEHVYKTVGDVELRIYVFESEDRRDKSPTPAIVYFFGGGWFGGTPEQFYPQCEYFATRGLLAASAEYRVKGTHGVSPRECVADGKSAIRWLRANAEELSIDSERIVAGGGSAGGHVAACAGMLEGWDEESEDLGISSKANALVLFNPGVDLLDISVEVPALEGFSDDEKKELSPICNIRQGLPPTIIFHGTEDATVPFGSVERFTKLMTDAGNSCKLIPFEGLGHGCFNYGQHDNLPYIKGTRATDEFLASLGCLEGEPIL